MKPWATMIRREFWEYRMLWLAPVAGVTFLVLSCAVFAIRMADMSFGPYGMFQGDLRRFDAPLGSDPFVVIVFVFSALIYGLGALATVSYALDCLYAERKDRSILFWKSLPVSDAKTVLSKVLVALVVMPLLLTGLAIATHVVCGALLSISPSPGSPVRMMWDAGRLLHAYGALLGVTAINALWFAPLIAYLMLASVLSSRLPVVTALIPVIVIAAGEKILFGTGHVFGWITHRFSTVYDAQRALASPDLWLGVVLAAALFAVVIRLRRWRDDG
jgi:ABC-2 type transport system permease protein